MVSLINPLWTVAMLSCISEIVAKAAAVDENPGRTKITLTATNMVTY